MKNKRAFILTLGILLMLAVLAACGPKTADTGGETPDVSEPASEIPSTQISPSGNSWLLDRAIILDPAQLSDDDALEVCGLLYDGLVDLDASGNPIPSLAIDWTVSDDELDYIFKLRPNVTFSSGTLFNADAVLANFNRWFDPASPLRGEGEYTGWVEYFLGFKGELGANEIPVSQFDGIEKVDDLTVLIHLNRPEPSLLGYLAQPYFYLVDPVVLATEGSSYGTQVGSVSGAGVYILTAWDENGLTLSPSSTYWGEKATEEVKTGWR